MGIFKRKPKDHIPMVREGSGKTRMVMVRVLDGYVSIDGPSLEDRRQREITEIPLSDIIGVRRISNPTGRHTVEIKTAAEVVRVKGSPKGCKTLVSRIREQQQ